MLNRAEMRAASETFRLLWWKSMQAAGGDEQVNLAIATMLMQLPEPEWKALYRWFLGLPIMRHWIGDRQVARVAVEGFEVIHKPYEATLGVLEDDIKFDKLGGYKPLIGQLSNEAKLLKFRELLKLIEDARAGTIYGNCFDGYPLISASHSTGTNLGTAALTHAALDAAIAAMVAQHDITNTNDRLMVRPKYLWYHDALQSTVENILDVRVVANVGTSTTHTDVAIDNKHYKKLIPLPLPLGSSYTAYWGLLADRPKDGVGPVLWQYTPEGAKFDAQDTPASESVFMRRELLFGISAWGAIAPGFPQYIWGSDGTT